MSTKTVAVLFGTLISAVTVLELVGVASRRRGDTITEDWTLIADHLPAPVSWVFRVFTLGFFAWCGYHFFSQP